MRENDSYSHRNDEQLLGTTMEPLGRGEDGASVNRGMESWHQLPAEEDPSQFLGQTSGLHEADCQHRVTLNPGGQMSIMGDSSMQPVADRFESLQLELQDSCLSPALTLIPQGKTFMPSESTLLHQTDLEFVPLRGSPDMSIASERCPRMSHLDVDVESNLTNRSHEQTSLSQHHLGVMSTILEDASSFCSLSQHSLSPNSNFQATQVHDEEHSSGLENHDERQLDAVISPPNTPQSLNKHSGVDQKQDADCTSAMEPQFKPSERREQPQGDSSSPLLQRRTMGRGSVSLSSHLSAISNITVRSTRKEPDDSHKQLQLHSDFSFSAPGDRNQSENKNTPSGQYISPTSAGGVCVAGLQRALWSSGSHAVVDGSFLTSQPVSQSTPAVLLGRGAPVPTKLSPIYSHQDTVATSTQNSSLKPGHIPALDLSTTNPQSIPGVTLVTSLDPVEAHTQSHIQHEVPHNQEAPSTGLDVPAVACEDTPLDQLTLATLLPTSDRLPKDQQPRLSAGKVHSLPSLSYLQKVDAWKANQSSNQSFYDNLTLQGFDGKRNQSPVLSEALNCILSQQGLQHPNKRAFITNNSTPSSQGGSGVLRRGDVEGAGGAVGPTSPSPLTHSHSHSSLGTVVTPIQQDGAQHSLQSPLICTDAISPGFNSTAVESSLPSSAAMDQRPADQSGTGPLKTSPLLSLDQYTDVPLNPNMSSTLSSFPGGCHVEQSLQMSLGASSSVVSLEVDNYAPYWTSRPGSPPRPFELNIEDRIPLYLRNLGIDQSPSTILNPFTHRGPIREPEFSPTDLCTIKGSVGTPTKSTQPSDGDSLQKETFSSSSVLSADSSASLTQQFLQKSFQQPSRPASPGSIRMAYCQTGTPPHASTVLQESDTPHQEGSYGLTAQLSLESAPPPGTWLSVRERNSSLVGSGTLQEIRRLLGRAESLVSSQSSLSSSPGSHCYSESVDSFLSLRQNTQAFHDDSSLSVDGKISLLLARSSSDSALKESSSSSCGPLQLYTQTDHMTKEPSTPSQSREDNPQSRDLRVAPRRAEPEGCSAADPDRRGLVSLSITQGNAPSTSDGQQQSKKIAENPGISSSEIRPTHSPTEAELGVLSDSSNEGSLAARVAKLLQSESPVSVVTSRPSTADPDESQAKDWIMMKVSGGKCEALELNAEDRKRIEEIKRELLLHTKHTKWSSDSESSSKSSVSTVPQPTVGFAAVRSAEVLLSEQLQRASQIPFDSNDPSHTPLEVRVRQIALREGLSPPAPLTSITSAQRTPQPASQCLHTHDSHDAHNDTAPENNMYTILRSAEEWKLQTQVTNRAPKTGGGKGAVGKDKEGRGEDEHQESERTHPSAIQEDVTGKREIPPGLESGSAPSHKHHFTNSHLTPSLKLQQNTIQRPHSPASDACNYPELQTGSHAHHSDSQNTSTGIPLTVSSTSEEHHASMSSETSLSKDRDAGQGQNTGMVSGYSQITSRYSQAFTPPQRRAGPSTSLVHTAAIPTLLPYKPHGSSELFYMPQTDPELSPNRSDTTMESSHPGSDDAVPPRFTHEVLGSRELEDDNVTPKHKEGIYSKRAKMKREFTVSATGFHDHRDNTGPPYQPTAFSVSGVSEKEQGAVHCTEQVEEEEEEEEEEAFIPLHMEADYSTTDLHHSQTVQKHNLATETLPIPPKAVRGEGMNVQDLGAEIGSSLDQLWRRFNESWSLQEKLPINEQEASLLERLERLSRLLHNSPLHTPTKQACSREEGGKSRRREHELRRAQEKDATKRGEEKERCKVKGVPKTAWEKELLRANQTLGEKEQQENNYRYPAERDESASVSVEMSSSPSTIDTQRLLRAFGPHRVSSGREEVTGSQTLRPNGNLLKLYNTINKQKGGPSKGSSKHHLISVATVMSSTDDSTASVDTLSSSSSLPSQRGTARTASSKRPKVKLISRGIQAGDLEIVVNGTRRHTRDVGTTFPSPGSARVTRASSPANSELKASISTLRAAPAQCQLVLRRQALNNQTCHPNGLSWFVSADELKRDVRKENKPQTAAVHSADQAWFEPYSRMRPWREPLRERHIQVEREKPPEHKTPSENSSSKPSALVRLSLQETLELHRPQFVSRSRERMKRLCLLAEERKMQAVFKREREELFNRPSPVQQPKTAPTAPPPPSKRIIPISEMVQRSKRIYAQLPEVQKRKEVERKRAECRTYRLNAQLFNKRITNRVLGRRAPWQ